jgi:putative ABC transport system ATP-binding protein
VIRALNVRHRFRRARERITLSFPDFTLASGEQVAVTGPSGSGKTTLLHLLAGLLVASEGEVWVHGQNLSRLGEAERDRYRARRVGYVFQDFHLIEGYTATENVVVGLGLAGVGGPHRLERARLTLEGLGLGERLRHLPRRLSTGERQRVALARAVAHRPGLLLADEPTAHLDRPRAEQALALLRETARDLEATLLLATHDPWVVGAFERRIEVAR